MNTLADLLAHAQRCRDETLGVLDTVNFGTALTPGMSQKRAVDLLTKNIADYEAVIRRLQSL